MGWPPLRPFRPAARGAAPAARGVAPLVAGVDRGSEGPGIHPGFRVRFRGRDSACALQGPAGCAPPVAHAPVGNGERTHPAPSGGRATVDGFGLLDHDRQEGLAHGLDKAGAACLRDVQVPIAEVTRAPGSLRCTQPGADRGRRDRPRASRVGGPRRSRRVRPAPTSGAGARTIAGRPAQASPSRRSSSSVSGSRAPPKKASRAVANSGSSGTASANRVRHERNFSASSPPSTPSAPSARCASMAWMASRNRAPSTGWAR